MSARERTLAITARQIPSGFPDAQANVRPGPDAELQDGAQFDAAGDHVLGGANPGAVPVQDYLHRADLAARCMLAAWLLLDDGDGRAEVLLAEDLRFSTPQIARFFDLTLSRRRLAAVAADGIANLTSPSWQDPVPVSIKQPLPESRTQMRCLSGHDSGAP